jgi:hypothetical protein
VATAASVVVAASAVVTVVCVVVVDVSGVEVSEPVSAVSRFTHSPEAHVSPELHVPLL